MTLVPPNAQPSPVPGVVLVWAGFQPMLQAVRVPPGGIVLGRELLPTTTDDRISRQHARVAWADQRFVITDLGSRNGTYVGGKALIGSELSVAPPSVIRTGRTVSVLLPDIRAFEAASVQLRHNTISGAITTALWGRLEEEAEAGRNLLLLGESGVGKGRMARSYARLRGRPEAVFNPTIQAVPLERIAAAHVETLVLEQIAKLRGPDLATLARLSTTHPRLRVVTTSAIPLDRLGIAPELASWLAPATLHVPPLRDRPDELAHLVQDAVRSSEPGLQIHSTLIEACLIRPWPGNVRQLVADVSRTAHAIASQGKNNVRGDDLDSTADHLMVGAPTINAAAVQTNLEARIPRRPTPPATDDD